MRVYVATSGEYSDYRVEAVFKNEEDARNFPFADDYLEFELLEGPADIRTKWYVSWNEGHDVYTVSSDEIYYSNDELHVASGRNYRGELWVRVSGWDKERVLKVLGDKKAELLARRHGV